MQKIKGLIWQCIRYRPISFRGSIFFYSVYSIKIFFSSTLYLSFSLLHHHHYDHHRPRWPSLISVSPCTLTQGQWDTPVTSTHLSFGRDECDVIVNYDTHSLHACNTVTPRLYHPAKEDKYNIQKSSTS